MKTITRNKTGLFLTGIAVLAAISFSILITLEIMTTPSCLFSRDFSALHVLLFFILNIMVEINYIILPHGRTLSGSFAIILASMLVFNPALAVIIGVSSNLLAWKMRGFRSAEPIFFRVTHTILVYSMAGAAITLSAPHIPQSAGEGFWEMLILGGAATIVYLFLHVPLKNIYTAISGNRDEKTEWAGYEYRREIGNVQEVIGILTMFPTAIIMAYAYDTTEVPFLPVIVAVLCIATVRYLGQMQLIAKLWSQAHFDMMLGIYNRRYVFEKLKEEIGKARRYRRPLSLILIDIDHFKEVNDIYGHEVGDLMLKSAVSIIESALRSTDTLARFGGDELMIVMPETTLENAESAAARIRKLIAEHKLAVGRTPSPSVTISAGIASALQEAAEETPETLVSRADEALYEAKRAGRNRLAVQKA